MDAPPSPCANSALSNSLGCCFVTFWNSGIVGSCFFLNKVKEPYWKIGRRGIPVNYPHTLLSPNVSSFFVTKGMIKCKGMGRVWAPWTFDHDLWRPLYPC